MQIDGLFFLSSDASGPIPADEPLVSDERLLDRIARTIVQTFTPEPDFFVKITDANATGAGPDDLIAVESARNESPNAGTIVIIREGEQVVCRRMNTTDKELRIEGVVVGTLTARMVKG